MKRPGSEQLRRIVFLIFIVVTSSVSGNINYIRLDSMTESDKHVDKFVYMQDNEDHCCPIKIPQEVFEIFEI